jgi:phosphatidylglycerophosphate synthase
MSNLNPRSVGLLTALTYIRIALVPVVMVLIALGDEMRFAYGIAAALFVIAALTDFFDGKLARNSLLKIEPRSGWRRSSSGANL